MSKHADSIRIVSTHQSLTPHLSDKIRRDVGGVITRFQAKNGGATVEIVPTNGHGVICKVDMLDQKGRTQHAEARERNVGDAVNASIGEMTRKLSSIQAETTRGGAHRPPYMHPRQGRGHGRGRPTPSHA